MDGNEQLAVIIPLLKEVGANIRPDQLDGSTPCAAFTVADVLDHMTGLASTYGPAFRGEPAPASDGASSGPDDRIARFQRAMEDLLDGVNTPGALERTLDTPFGPMPGATFAHLVAFDGIIHGWDLAISTRQPWQPPEHVVAEIDAFARRALLPEMRDGDTFAAETTARADAGTLERLVAFSGRTT